MRRNKSFIFLVVCAAAVGVSLGGWTNAAIVRQAQVQNPCSNESKNKYYEDFLVSYEGNSRDQTKALEAATQYLACPVDSNDQEEILAKLNLAVGRLLSLKDSYTEAIPYFRRAASYNSSVKSSPQTYAELAEAYEEGPYAKASAAYGRRYSGKDETDESLLELENIHQIIDRIIDAYARAMALAGGELQKPADRGRYRNRGRATSPTDWIDPLTNFYKYRHNQSDAGLKELIGTILSQPLLGEPIPITSLAPSRKKKTRGNR